MIVVVDYGMGNLRSVSKALESLKAGVQVTSDPAAIRRADKLVLPGVGAFGAAMGELSRRGLVEPLRQALGEQRPYLGICLGLQLLFESSEEHPGVPGLGVLAGAVRALPRAASTEPARLKVPHMGWNQIDRPRSTVHGPPDRCPLLEGIPNGSFFYFVHSYYGQPQDRAVVALETDYGVRFASMVWRDRLFATQFHPEKSQAVGLRLLQNFVNL